VWPEHVRTALEAIERVPGLTAALQRHGLTAQVTSWVVLTAWGPQANQAEHLTLEGRAQEIATLLNAAEENSPQARDAQARWAPRWKHARDLAAPHAHAHTDADLETLLRDPTTGPLLAITEATTAIEHRARSHSGHGDDGSTALPHTDGLARPGSPQLPRTTAAIGRDGHAPRNRDAGGGLDAQESALLAALRGEASAWQAQMQARWQATTQEWAQTWAGQVRSAREVIAQVPNLTEALGIQGLTGQVTGWVLAAGWGAAPSGDRRAQRARAHVIADLLDIHDEPASGRAREARDRWAPRWQSARDRVSAYRLGPVEVDDATLLEDPTTGPAMVLTDAGTPPGTTPSTSAYLGTGLLGGAPVTPPSAYLWPNRRRPSR
jgi:hypothetical protein